MHEIDEQGNICKLTDKDTVPTFTTSETSSKVRFYFGWRDQAETPILKPSGKHPDLEELIGKEHSDAIILLSAMFESEKPELTLPPIESKDHRSKVHHYIKRQFPTLATETQKDSNIIRVVKKGYAKLREDWPPSAPQFVQFYLYKENKDTLEALGIVARLLRFQKI